MSSISQPELNLTALRSGDRAEFARLVDAYSGQIYRLALKMLQDSQDAEDILQETFIKAYRALPDFEGRSSISTWLYRIATNEALMFLRR
ncbi:MAG TPA: sigma-70 family RNA polymerase sigma factor, partial [Anaerolineales bacterium]|nr:sigma-70 family RNA polymerase sigma factor [Anaerolineales bacterium]